MTANSAHFPPKNRCNVTDLFPPKEALSFNSDRDWARLRQDLALPVAQLNQRYPAEWNCYRSMRGREKSVGAVIAPAFRTFKGFFASVGPCPKPGYTIDRIDPRDSEYGPGKVRWASKTTQANNRTNTIMLTGMDGRVRPLAEWARITRQKPDTMRRRIRRGWTDPEVIAGRRDDGEAAHRKAPTKDQWPSIVSKPQQMEQAWDAWTKLDGYKGLSRNAFFVWMATNIQRQRLVRLERQFPDQIGDNAGPLSIPCTPLTDSPEYQEYVRTNRVLTETLNELSPAEHRDVDQLLHNEKRLITLEAMLDRINEIRAATRAVRYYRPPW